MEKTLNDRMKEFYENRTRIQLPRRAYTIIRLDGKSFSKYTKKMKKPFDNGFITAMQLTAKKLCEEIQGAQLAYVQSDEISILITDFETRETQAWFDNNIQKMCSISASIATSEFNKVNLLTNINTNKILSHVPDTIMAIVTNYKPGNFDSRVFQIPSRTEVINYFIWRQQDAMRNSVSMAAHHLLKGSMENKNVSKKKELLLNAGHDWDKFSMPEKQGTFIIKKDTLISTPNGPVQRKKWDFTSFVITDEKELIEFFIPKYD